MHQMQWQVLHSQTPPKLQKFMGNKRGRTKEIHKELQDLDLVGSPHLERDLIGGNLDLDLLTLFPQEYARIMEGIKN